MPAYIVVEHIVTDAAKFEEYRSKIGPMLAKYGARSLTKGGSHEMPEGGHWKPKLVAVIEFPDMKLFERLVQLVRIPAADGASERKHKRPRYDVLCSKASSLQP